MEGVECPPPLDPIDVQMFWACHGLVILSETGWGCWKHDWWVIDVTRHENMRQRIGNGREFQRAPGIVSLYAPGCRYYEYYRQGSPQEVNYVSFIAHGRALTYLRRLTGRDKWCHFRDPDKIIAERLASIGQEWKKRQPGYEYVTQGELIQLLGWLFRSQPVGKHERILRRPVPNEDRKDLPGRVESFIRAHLTESLHIADLARHVGLSVSVLTHTYPGLAGESPYRTIQRLKLEAAKQLLQDGLTVKEVAGQLRFSSESHFSRLFKRLEGISPLEHRRMIMKPYFYHDVPKRKS